MATRICSLQNNRMQISNTEDALPPIPTPPPADRLQVFLRPRDPGAPVPAAAVRPYVVCACCDIFWFWRWR